ncbi:hypothetical protein LCGC14_0801840 [marine sediment metagenome]|uniref:Uncharacterized protein n=1 Tax=marine sediment metagenome TaxID=412755 RepID=A0A0F9PPD2_9ZZZZ
MPDYLQLHKDKVLERADLNKRRDSDNELLTSYKYEMTDSKDKKLEDIIHVTMNRLKVFAAYVEAALNKADEKVNVTSEDEKIDTAEIEDYIKAGFASANLRLVTRGDFALDPYFDQQACRRGEAAARVMFQMVEAKEGVEPYLDADITQWDTRYITYETGSDGLAWGAYETTKSKGMIESSKWALESNFTMSGKSAEVIDLWTPEENIIYVAEKEVFKQTNPWGFVNVCVQKVPIGSMLADKDSLQYQCESILFLVRDLINEYNRCVSLLQTLNIKSVKAALQEATKGEAHTFEEINASGSVTPVETPGAIAQIPYGDAKNSMILALQEIKEALDDGTLARIMLGDLPGEMSAVALIQVEQGQGQVYMPRLGTRGMLKQQIALMFIKQTKDLGTVNLGTPGHRKDYKMSDMEGEYDIEFVYANKSPETDFARLSLGREYKEADMLDELSILTDVMKRDDPEGDQRKLFRQRLRRISPNLQMLDGLMALAKAVEDGDESATVEIDIIEAELNVSLESVLAGNLPQSEEQGGQPVNEPLAVRGSAQKAADLKKTPVDLEV